jgi:DNA-binding transcriptional regulator YhcF (GntR family)
MVYSQRTSGCFVTDDMRVIGHAKQRFAEEQIRSFLTAMEKLGYTRGEILTMLEEKETEHDNT